MTVFVTTTLVRTCRDDTYPFDDLGSCNVEIGMIYIVRL